MTAETVTLKKEIRKKIKLLKKNLNDEERRIKSEAALNILENTAEFKNARTVFIFWSMDDEIDTRDFIVKWSDRKRFVLPAINGDELLLKLFTGVQRLVEGVRYSIPEPEGKPFGDLEQIDLAIIPGVAFDRDNERLGRGKAYYDRILHRMKGKIPLFGLCYDFQMIEKVPVEDHDVKMDGVIYA